MAVYAIFWCLSMVLLQMVTTPSIAMGNRPRFPDQAWKSLSPPPADDPEPEKCRGKTWAVLVAGSNEWYNYRHQVKNLHRAKITYDPWKEFFGMDHYPHGRWSIQSAHPIWLASKCICFSCSKMLIIQRIQCMLFNGSFTCN